ncbi:toll/interleukin-1 receptor domain-containing protein [Hyphomonas sp.]|uniref:toll/interleukin-1 receptor domain-containing protein n=1 Tax=Hyphomonas sp. TaxID=87 RepID=UPI0025BEE76B|nr:toll/interleukin-1 receptor domain-containing protein [Hyphomonas sp.]
MPDVFVSYKKTDRDRVRPIIIHLRAAGLDVWWDEGIAPSMSWRAEIAKQLGAAKCIVAIWTEASVDHDQGQWVMEEASQGLIRRVLAPVRLDLVAPPLGFGEVQFADLAAWSGGADDPRFQHFLSVVQSIVRSEPLAVGPTPTSFEAPGIKLSGVRMQNVSIHVTPRGAADKEEDAPDEAPRAARVAVSPPKRAPFSLSMMITRAIGVIFPLIALYVFVTSMGRMQCEQNAAPEVFCQSLDAISGGPNKPAQ